MHVQKCTTTSSRLLLPFLIALIFLLPPFCMAAPNIPVSGQLVDLNKLAARSVSANPAKAIEHAEVALNLAIASNNYEAQSIALLNIGLAHLQLGNLTQMKRSLENSLHAAQQADYKKGQGDAHNFLGTYYWEDGLFDQAQKHYTQAVAIRAGLKDRIGMSKSINNLGQVQRKIGNYDKAIDYYQESLAMKGGEDATGRTNTLVNLALVYKETRNYTQALRLMDQALDVAKSANYLQGQAFARRSIGETQLEMKLLPEALINLQQAADLYEQVNYRKGIAFSYASIGQVYEELGNNTQAISFYEKAVRVAEKIEQRKLAADLYYASARIAQATGNSAVAWDFTKKASLCRKKSLFPTCNSACCCNKLAMKPNNNKLSWTILNCKLPGRSWKPETATTCYSQPQSAC